VGGGRCDCSASEADAGERRTDRAARTVGTPDDLIAAAEHALHSAQLAGGHQDRYVDVANLLSADVVACQS
jgi:hypothetical protein